MVLAFFVEGEVLDGKGEFRVSRIDGVQFIAISGFCSLKRGICFGDIGKSMPLTFSDVK